MTEEQLISALRPLIETEIPPPAVGSTALRHKCLMEIGRRNLSLARLAEAHWDAVAILAEAGRKPQAGAIYGVWAAEIPGQPIRVEKRGDCLFISGSKMFCSGAGLIDRTLLTVRDPEELLLDVDLRGHSRSISSDNSEWKTDAFLNTRTSTVTFSSVPVHVDAIIGSSGWYLSRPGFWHGACGPAACWAGGAAGLVDFATQQSRQDAHTVAHLAAMQANIWAMQSYLDSAGHEIDAYPHDAVQARIRARTVRHLIEQSCTDVLRRFSRAYGPYPLAMNADISGRYKGLDLYLRQSHGERDLEALGHDLRQNRKRPGQP